jgi:hypothetical protein
VPLVRGEIQQPSQYISNEFQARYVISDLNHKSFIQRADADPYMEMVYRDDQSIIFRVTR